MSANDCIFCKIIAKQVQADIVTENDDILVIKDLHPKTPVHYLILPKKHIENLQVLDDSDAHYAEKIMLMARELSKHLSGSHAFRLVMNNGADVGQSVFHMHCHFLSGQKMTDY